MDDFDTYKQILRILSLSEKEFIGFWSYIPNDIGALKIKNVNVRETPLFKFVDGCWWHFQHASTHTDSNDKSQEVQDQLLWLLETLVSLKEDHVWTGHYIKSQDAWSLVRKLANEILVFNEWCGGVTIKEGDLLKACDVDRY